MQSEQIDKLAEALAQAQGEISDPHKGKEAKAGSYSYKYADIADVLKVVRSALSKHHIAVVQPTLFDGEFIVVRTRLIHKSGQYVESDYPVCKATGEHQKMGAAMTYARRYALCSLVGVAADEDTDAQGAAKVEVAKVPSGAAMKRGLAELDHDLSEIHSIPKMVDCWHQWQNKMDKENWPPDDGTTTNYRNMAQSKFDQLKGALAAKPVEDMSNAELDELTLEHDERDPADLHPLEAG